MALALLPFLNDLRQARDKPSLSEGTLVLLNSGPFERNLPPRPAAAGRRTSAAASRRSRSGCGRRSRRRCSVGSRAPTPARYLRRAVARLHEPRARGCHEQVKQLWTIMAGVLTAVRGGGLEASVTLKRLIGQVDRQLKKLFDGGESALVSSPPVELINSLLYYVARARSQDPRIGAPRKQYNLGEVLPGQAQIEQAREGLAGPSVKLMRTVAQAIKEELGTVKDALDIFVRTGMKGADRLEPAARHAEKDRRYARRAWAGQSARPDPARGARARRHRHERQGGRPERAREDRRHVAQRRGCARSRARPRRDARRRRRSRPRPAAAGARTSFKSRRP